MPVTATDQRASQARPEPRITTGTRRGRGPSPRSRCRCRQRPQAVVTSGRQPERGPPPSQNSTADTITAVAHEVGPDRAAEAWILIAQPGQRQQHPANQHADERSACRAPTTRGTDRRPCVSACRRELSLRHQPMLSLNLTAARPSSSRRSHSSPPPTSRKKATTGMPGRTEWRSGPCQATAGSAVASTQDRGKNEDEVDPPAFGPDEIRR